jgi:hypothetical protein
MHPLCPRINHLTSVHPTSSLVNALSPSWELHLRPSYWLATPVTLTYKIHSYFLKCHCIGYLIPKMDILCVSRTSPGSSLLVNSVISQKTSIFNSTAVATSYLGRLSSFQFTFNPFPVSKTSETMRKVLVGQPQFDLTSVSSFACLSYKCQAYAMFDF